ncbi:MAG TPA: C-GCAxxG-C-C family (seleno)protein [Syntrophomonas sp.]|nr:C-GCAxxG-C-C family (seleno)protein [Syntrophomonas sp.]
MNQSTGKKSVEEQARDYFVNDGLHCSEAIFKAFNEYLDLKLDEKTLRMATGLAAGLGKAGCSCGSITSGALVISALYGRISSEEDDQFMFDLSRQLHQRFTDIYQYSCCRILTRNVSWAQPDHVALCSDYIYTASRIVQEILEETEKTMRPSPPKGGELRPAVG